MFYIGIVQQGSGLLNVGFDASNDNSRYNFINVTGSWQQSSKAGSIMLRPVVGAGYYIGLDEIETSDIAIYPNPAASTLHVTGLVPNASVAVYDITGRQVAPASFTDEIDVSGLHDGLYLLVVTNSDGSIVTRKFMVKK